jgi:hypothetical protein
MKALVFAFCLSLLLAGIAPAADSLNVRLIGSWDSPGHAYDVAVVGDYAYVVAETAGLRVISVADPAHPTEVGHCGTPGLAYGVAVSGDYAYVADWDSGLRVISVADPAHPVEVGNYAYVPGAADVAVMGDYVHVADNRNGLCVVSVADPANPVQVGRYVGTGEAYGVRVVGDYAYLAGGSTGLRVISVADPAHPFEVGYGSLPLLALSLAVDGGYAYVAYGSLIVNYGGLRVISIADPANLVEAGHYEFSSTSSTFYSVAYSGGCAYVTHWPALKVLEFYGEGVEEAPNAEVRRTNSVPTVVRTVFLLPEATSHKPQAASLLDASGRKVLDLRPGANDVAHLAPGVYFVLSEPSAVGRQPSAVAKVIISR